jgi:hypothetical protein
MERVKTVIFCHPFEQTEKHQDVLKRLVLKDGRSVLWLYGPGIVNNGRWEPANVKKVCGTDFKIAGVNTVDMGDWTSIYIHDPTKLTPEIMRTICVNSGCHLYCSKLRPICANKRLLSVHTGVADDFDIFFPNQHEIITELFSGRKYLNTDRVKITASGPDTFLFLCE